MRAGRHQLGLFGLCVLLAAMAVSLVSGWRASVDQAMEGETRKGAGGDVVAFTTEPFSESLLLAAQDYDHIQTAEMFTVALAPERDRTLFSKLKSVEPGYPYYGEVPLASGRDLHQALKEGLVVEQRVLERLETEIGQPLKLGDRTFLIADVALSEPDRPLGMWGVSPRIFISDQDLGSTGLMRPDSYAERRIHIKLDDPQKSEEVAEALRAVAIPDQERVESWQKPPVNMERYVTNFFTFLDLMAVVAVALGGLGMQSTLSTWLRSRTHTIATIKTCGADSSFVLRHYAAIVGSATGVAFLLGVIGAALLLLLSGDYLTAMLPIQVQPRLTPRSVVESALLCAAVTALFASWPLSEVRAVRPAVMLRGERYVPQGGLRWRVGLLVLVATYGLLALLVKDAERALWLTVGLGALVLVTGLASLGLVRAVKRWRPASLTLRTAIGSWRSPEARPELVVFILSTCLAVLYTVTICERALRSEWVEAMPPESPNLIFFDIQPHQKEAFEQSVGLDLKVYTNLRVRVKSINGEPLDRSGSREYWQRDGRGKLDASPLDEVPENDELIEGETLYQGEATDQVSIREDIARKLEISVGDRVTFSVQGVPLEATVSSIRKSSRRGFQPSFELLFPPELLDGAPVSIFASTRLAPDKVGALQARLAREFPSIISMDIGLSIKLVAERLFQMVGLVRVFLLSGLISGLLILVSALWSARQRRAREAAYFKVVGASKGFLNRVIWWENGMLGLACSGLAYSLAWLVSWGLCRWRLEIELPPMGQVAPVMILAPALVVTLLGWWLSRPVIAARPATYLREG